MVFSRSDEEEELEAGDDEEATLADDILDEVEEESIPVEDEMEGFGHLEDLGDKDKKDDKVGEEDEGGEEGDAPLEEDAEDVDFDTFDDVDEM